MKKILLIILVFFGLTSYSQPLVGIIASSANNSTTSAPQNLVRYSEVLSNASWNKTVTILDDQEYDLTGGLTLDKITTSATNQSIYSYPGGTYVTVFPGTTYRLSFDVKRGTMTNVYYSIYDQTHSVDIIAPTSYYSLTSSTVQRISFSFTIPSGCTQIRAFPLRNSGIGTIFIGRVQIESNGSAYTVTTSSIIP